MVPTPIIKCTKCKVALGIGSNFWKCISCARAYHGGCLGIPGSITASFDMMKILRDAGCIVCEECKGAYAAEGAASKRRREEPGTSANDAEQRCEILKQQNDELVKHVTDLRRQVTELTQSPPTSARSDVMKRENLDEPVTMGQVVRMNKDMMKEMMEHFKKMNQKMFEEILKNQQGQRPVTPIRIARPPVSFANTVRGENRQRSISRQSQRVPSGSRDPSPLPPRSGKNRRARQQQPLLLHNPSVSTAQAFAVSTVELANRFNILSTVEDEAESFELMNQLQGSVEIQRAGKIKTIVKRSNRCIAVGRNRRKLIESGHHTKV